MQNKSLTLIDLDKIVRDRAGSKAKYIPQFLLNWLKKIVHQDFINGYLKEGYVGVDFCENCLRYLDVKVEVEGLENLSEDKSKTYTFVSNHPLGAIDGVTLGMVLGRHYQGEIKYIVNDLLMNLPGLAPLCVPINKTGQQSRSFPAMVEAVFRGDNHIVMFPAGICSRRIDGQIHDLPWKKTFITKSVETHRDVVPIHFGGRNSDFFYNLANLCKRLGVKFNIAMLYLADEMYKNRHKTFRVAIGKPIPWQTFDKSKTPMEWAKYVQDIVYKL